MSTQLHNSYSHLPKELYSQVEPTKVANPQLIIVNEGLIESLGVNALRMSDLGMSGLGISQSNLSNKEMDEATRESEGKSESEGENLTTQANWHQLFSGNQLFAGSQPIAQAYAGHQFGHLNVLGDGRAILLGEISTAEGLIDLQLKGSGRTPYSRGGDGRASLAPMLREYLISEAMSALAIPTTRSLAVVATGESVYRRQTEQGAVLARTASSHIRVGTFVYANLLYLKARHDASLNSKHQHTEQHIEQENIKHSTAETQSDLETPVVNALNVLTELLDYTVHRHYSQFDELTTDKKALALLEAVIDKQAQLVAHWQRVGFIHGVMNTDNITISGESIDYGPCAFMDEYDEKTVFSSIDHQGRYAFGNQMPMMWWNIARFAESLLPLIHTDASQAVAMAEDIIQSFGDKFQGYWAKMLCAKIGLPTSEIDCANQLLKLMQTLSLDHTNTFKNLTLLLMTEQADSIDIDDVQIQQWFGEAVKNEAFLDWLHLWYSKVQALSESAYSLALQQMQAYNPLVIPRNHLVEEALTEAKQGNMDTFYQLLAILQQPYRWDEQHIEVTQPFQQPASHQWQASYQTFCGT